MRISGAFALATLVLVVAMVLARVVILHRMGVRALRFGEKDPKDFLILPFAFFFFYLVAAEAFNLPKLGQVLFTNEAILWFGRVLCVLGLLLIFFSLIAFGKSFRVGLDEEHPGPLVTSGVFGISRNPIYTGMGCILVGIFFLIPNWILLLYVVAGFWLLNRQVNLEEASLKRLYGEAYREYCRKVRRYL